MKDALLKLKKICTNVYFGIIPLKESMMLRDTKREIGVVAQDLYNTTRNPFVFNKCIKNILVCFISNIHIIHTSTSCLGF